MASFGKGDGGTRGSLHKVEPMGQEGQEFGELRSLCHRTLPSPRGWQELGGWFAQTGRGQDPQALEYVRSHLRSWPAQVCLPSAKELEDALHGRLAPMVWLAKTIRGGSRRLENVGAQALAQLELGGVERMELGGQLLHREAIASLMRAGWMGQVGVLDVGNNPIGDGGIDELAEAGPWPGLWSLGLRATGISRVGLARLLDSSLMLHVRQLDLSANRLGDGFGEVFGSRAYKVGKLQGLRLEQCGLGDRMTGVSVRRHVGRLAGLSRLSVANNRLGARELEDFLEGVGPVGIESLDVGGNEVSPEVLDVLGGGGWPALRRLHATWDAATLARLEVVHRLESLKLTQPDWSVLEALAGVGGRMGQLRELEVVGRDEPKAHQSVLRVLQRAWVGRLERLSLQATSMSRPGELVEALGQVKWEGLKVLALDANGLEDHHVVALGRCGAMMRDLETISLKHHQCKERESVEFLLAQAPRLKVAYVE